MQGASGPTRACKFRDEESSHHLCFGLPVHFDSCQWNNVFMTSPDEAATMKTEIRVSLSGLSPEIFAIVLL